jgi:hypothetical protein
LIELLLLSGFCQVTTDNYILYWHVNLRGCACVTR